MIINKLISYKCLRCGKWSGKQLNHLYREDMTHLEQIKAIKRLYCSCKYCGHTVKFKKENDYMTRLSFRWFSNEREMTRFISSKNGEKYDVTLADFE